MIGKLPDQLKLPFYLWTRAAVARYLKAWCMSPQKPARRAYERSDAAISRWLSEDYPALARQAKREKAVIFAARSVTTQQQSTERLCLLKL